MLGPIVRKGRQLLEDPVLCRWLIRRALRLEPGPPPFVAGRPPYLTGPLPPTGNPVWQGGASTTFPPPAAPVCIALAGTEVETDPGDPGALFRGPYDDLETELSAHRFAWVPVAGRAVDPAWVAALWTAWLDMYDDSGAGWPWHAYTAAERAINIIDFARRHGLPGDPSRTAAALARHADVIGRNLEYFGDHYTSNHLSNNGRGLLRIGAALGLERVAAFGADIMVAEARRILGPSGLLREGSSHYHLLITRNYVDAWLEAARVGLPQADALREAAARAIAAAPLLRLSGGLPLIGDISPDCPPSFLLSLADPGGTPNGWVGGLDPAKAASYARLLSVAHAADARPDIAADGWHRFGAQDWDALAFVPADGWAPMPGHGHRDLGSFELHCAGVPVVTDPGRGSYRSASADRLYESADVHGGLSIDGRAPSPQNRPYYSPAFRERVIGAPPEFTRSDAGAHLVHSGFSRLGGVGAVSRSWAFGENGVRIADRVDGRGRRRIRRQFVTPHPVSVSGSTAEIAAPGARFHIAAGTGIAVRTLTCWSAYADGRPGTLIVAEEEATLPFDAVSTIERIR